MDYSIHFGYFYEEETALYYFNNRYYDTVLDGIKNKTRTANIATKKLMSVSKRLIRTWGTETLKTTAKYVLGTIVSTTGKRSFIKSLRY